jgi:hypothetical protein
LLIGTFVTLCGVYAGNIAMLLAGTVVAGLGFGSGFFGAVRVVVPLALPHQRAGLLSVMLVVCYLAVSLPTIVAGLAVPMLGLVKTLYIYGIAVIVLSAISLFAIVASLRNAA